MCICGSSLSQKNKSVSNSREPKNSLKFHKFHKLYAFAYKNSFALAKSTSQLKAARHTENWQKPLNDTMAPITVMNHLIQWDANNSFYYNLRQILLFFQQQFFRFRIFRSRVNEAIFIASDPMDAQIFIRRWLENCCILLHKLSCCSTNCAN